MTIFKPGLEEKLAETFAKRPGELVAFYETLKKIGSLGFFEFDVASTSSYVAQALSVIEKSPHVIFYTYDSWSANGDGNGEGFTLYQLVNKEFVSKLELDSDGVPAAERVVDYLHALKIDHVFTTRLTREVSGLSQEMRDDDEVVLRKPVTDGLVDPYYLNYLKAEKIEVTYVPLELLVK